MTYETAPATILLATNCAFCARPLVDAASVEAGVGPECRKRHGMNQISEELRVEANELIYQIALKQDGTEVSSHLLRLRDMGLEKIADRIEKRLAETYFAAIMKDEGELFSVKCGYHLSMSAGLGFATGGRWDKERKVRTFPISSKREVFERLKKVLPGGKCLGPKGEFSL